MQLMKKKFSLLTELTRNLAVINNIYNCIKITLGPTGKGGIVATKENDVKFLVSGSQLIKSLEFSTISENVILKLFEQASIKTYEISGDGTAITILLSCELLKNSLNLVVSGYNSIFLSNGLKKIAFFLIEKVLEFSLPINNINQLNGILKTSLGKKLNIKLYDLLSKSIGKIARDGLILVEENLSPTSEIETVQGIELDKGFASSYFVNELKSFEVIYENPYILIANDSLTSLRQIRDIIDYIKSTNRALIIISEEISKEILSTLILNSIQKKMKIAVIKYSSIKFLKTGILDDLGILTHSNYFASKEISLKNNSRKFLISELGQAEKVIIKKDKSTFLISKFSKLVAKRRINELNRELLTSETEYEKTILKTRIARLSGNISKLKIGTSNKYQIEEERKKVENSLTTIKASLEEGIVPGGGIFYFYLRDELKNWSYLNLIGDEIFSSQITMNALEKPFYELCNNTNTTSYSILENLKKVGYPYAYNLVDKKIVHSINSGLVDSAKSVRAILWNSLSIISTLLTSE